MPLPRPRLSSQQAINNLINYSHGELLTRFSGDFFLSFFDQERIALLEKTILKGTPLSKLDFIRELTCFIPHQQDETLFLVMSLIDIYHEICEELGTNDSICIVDFSNYICDKITSKSYNQDALIATKEIAPERNRPDIFRIRSIDISPPIVLSELEKDNPKISREIKKKDKMADAHQISNFYYNHQRNEIITLGFLSSSISILKTSLKQSHRIMPTVHENLPSAILSMAFCEKYQRIGCIINHTGLAFWDYSDHFATEKIITQFEGDTIYYLLLSEQWVTTTTNSVLFWDLLTEASTLNIHQPTATKITDLVEINHIRALAACIVLQNQSKWVYIYRYDGYKRNFKLRINVIGTLKLSYNLHTQTVLTMGSTNLSVYSVLPSDMSLVVDLIGHDTVITSVCAIENKFVLSGDAFGSVRIWDLVNMRCQQVIKIASSLLKLICVGNQVIFADCRINVLQLEKQARKTEDLYGIRVLFIWNSEMHEAFIFTLKTCRVVDMATGRTKKVVEICNEEDISAVAQLNSFFIIGTTHGVLQAYSHKLLLKWSILAHQLEIVHVLADCTNRFIMTVGREGNLFVWNQRGILNEDPRKAVESGAEERMKIILLKLSERYGFFLTTSKQESVKLWDYESCRCIYSIKLPFEPTAIHISSERPLIVIACANQTVYCYKFERREQTVTVKFIYSFRLPQHEEESKPQILTDFQSNTDNLCITYGKGSVVYYDITNILEEALHGIGPIRMSPNVQRPVKQNMHQQLRNQPLLCISIPDMPPRDDHFELWNKKLHKDSIADLCIIEGRDLSTISLDGYFKITNVKNGQTICSMNINHPLPISWAYKIKKYHNLCKKVIQGIKLVGEILNHSEKQPTKEEFEALNLESFLNRICKGKTFSKSFPTEETAKIEVLKDELSPEDFRKCFKEAPLTLKSIEAIKRVSFFKKEVKEKEVRCYSLKRTSNQEKDGLINLLSPNRFNIIFPNEPRRKSSQIRFNKFSLVHSLQKKMNSKILQIDTEKNFPVRQMQKSVHFSQLKQSNDSRQKTKIKLKKSAISSNKKLGWRKQISDILSKVIESRMRQ